MTNQLFNPFTSLFQYYGLELAELSTRQQLYQQKKLPKSVRELIEKHLIQSINPELNLRTILFLENNFVTYKRLKKEIPRLRISIGRLRGELNSALPSWPNELEKKLKKLEEVLELKQRSIRNIELCLIKIREGELTKESQSEKIVSSFLKSNQWFLWMEYQKEKSREKRNLITLTNLLGKSELLMVGLQIENWELRMKKSNGCFITNHNISNQTDSLVSPLGIFEPEIPSLVTKSVNVQTEVESEFSILIKEDKPINFGLLAYGIGMLSGLILGLIIYNSRCFLRKNFKKVK